MKHESRTGKQAILITGRVVRGEKLGRKLGFPTANLDRRQLSKLKLKPKFGVWAGIASYKLSATSYKSYKAGIVIGPKDKQGLPKIEAYLLNFSGNLYGKILHLKLNKFLRPYRKFRNIIELQLQIKRDIEKVKKIKVK